MQEHFNEKYMESEKYPKAAFNGAVTGFTKKPGKQNATAEGELTIHGVTNKVTINGVMEFKDGKVFMNSSFIVKLEDYKIKIPSILFQNIAEEIEVKVELTYKEYGE
jgi:polyisoprenoid-binding protein YceI